MVENCFQNDGTRREPTRFKERGGAREGLSCPRGMVCSPEEGLQSTNI